MSNVTGTCHCGACSYASDATPKFAIRCYCSDCREISGASHLPQLGMDASGVTFDGPIAQFTSKAESGSDLQLQFCPRCSSPLSKSTSRAPELLFLMIGTVAADVELPEIRNVFEDGRPNWDRRD